MKIKWHFASLKLANLKNLVLTNAKKKNGYNKAGKVI